MNRRYGTSPTGDQPIFRISSSDMACSSPRRSAEITRNDSRTSGPDMDRIDSTHRSLPSAIGFFRWAVGNSTSGAGRPCSMYSVPMMWDRLSCTVQPGQRLGVAQSSAGRPSAQSDHSVQICSRPPRIRVRSSSMSMAFRFLVSSAGTRQGVGLATVFHSRASI